MEYIYEGHQAYPLVFELNFISIMPPLHTRI
ncbi:hypothetical protein AF72_07310 [Xylella taiwanensis]|uniref:Uncharacterized protein n=1 Tax=Xylella taiwanensis TaxID=1444770 RepID=Z9JIB3_9GAMM|nr:hypothetical protein AF72_07310 [Xylella taiwanensis]